jgi:ABC-2 type transport system permease protein
MLRSELLKITTTTAPKIALGVGAGGLILTQLISVSVLPALASGRMGAVPADLRDALPSLDLVSTAGQLTALSPLGASGGSGSLGIAVIAIVLLGVLAGTSDYRFGGIVGTFLAQPNRVRILMAKAGAAGVAGLVTGALFAAVSVLTLLATLWLLGIPIAVEPLVIGAVLSRSMLAIACLTVIGLAVGILARSQLAAVLVMLGLLLLELVVQSIAQLIVGSMPVWAELLPLALTNAVIGTGESALPLAGAAAALLGLTAVALALAATALRRRDV